jgi:plasmid stabilization system protein ParE
MKLTWTHEALNRLIEIEGYIAEDSPTRAQKFINQIIQKAESLKKHPQRGRIVPEFSIPELRELIYKNYRIVYIIKYESLEILTVFESHRLIRINELIKE